MNQPSIGRIVHYKDSEGRIVPGIITGIVQGKTAESLHAVNVQLFYDMPQTEPRGATNITMASSPGEAQNGEWYWPERV